MQLVQLHPTCAADDTQAEYAAHTATVTTREGLRATREYVRAYSPALTVRRERLPLCDTLVLMCHRASTWPLTVWAERWLPRGASVAQDLPATPNKHRHQSERQLIHRPGHRCDPPMRPCRCPLRPQRAHGTLSTYRCRWRGSGTPCMTSPHPRGRQPGGSTAATPCITPPN